MKIHQHLRLRRLRHRRLRRLLVRTIAARGGLALGYACWIVAASVGSAPALQS